MSNDCSHRLKEFVQTTVPPLSFSPFKTSSTATLVQVEVTAAALEVVVDIVAEVVLETLEGLRDDTDSGLEYEQV